MIVQLPGPRNSLGLVKFDMRNDQAIYLHDTPAKALFARDQRHFSHGCVRVQDALGFAEMIAQHEGVRRRRREARPRKTRPSWRCPARSRCVCSTTPLRRRRPRALRADEYGWVTMSRWRSASPHGPQQRRAAARRPRALELAGSAWNISGRNADGHELHTARLKGVPAAERSLFLAG